MEPNYHCPADAGEGAGDGVAAVALVEGSIGHLHPVPDTASMELHIETFKCQLNPVANCRLKCPYL